MPVIHRRLCQQHGHSRPRACGTPAQAAWRRDGALSARLYTAQSTVRCSACCAGNSAFGAFASRHIRCILPGCELKEAVAAQLDPLRLPQRIGFTFRSRRIATSSLKVCANTPACNLSICVEQPRTSL
eukprot:6172458-Pleurochrysis_carterae.AAC.3